MAMGVRRRLDRSTNRLARTSGQLRLRCRMIVMAFGLPGVLLALLRQVEYLLFPEHVNADELAKDTHQVGVQIEEFEVCQQFGALRESRYAMINDLLLFHQLCVGECATGNYKEDRRAILFAGQTNLVEATARPRHRRVAGP